MSYRKAYTIDDFKIGERVIPVDAKDVRLVVVNVDREQKVIICRMPNERSVRAYFPYELEKEISVKPPDMNMEAS